MKGQSRAASVFKIRQPDVTFLTPKSASESGDFLSFEGPKWKMTHFPSFFGFFDFSVFWGISVPRCRSGVLSCSKCGAFSDLHHEGGAHLEHHFTRNCNWTYSITGGTSFDFFFKWPDFPSPKSASEGRHLRSLYSDILELKKSCPHFSWCTPHASLFRRNQPLKKTMFFYPKFKNCS